MSSSERRSSVVGAPFTVKVNGTAVVAVNRPPTAGHRPPASPPAVRPWHGPRLTAGKECPTAKETPTAGDADAASVVEAARQEAGRVLASAREEAERLREAAREEGFREGRAVAEAALAAERDRIQCLAGGIGDAYRRFCEAQVPELARLARAAAERLLCAELQAQPSRVDAVVREALAAAQEATRVVLHLHPDDLNLFAQVPRSPEPGARSPEPELRADAGIERGGCRVTSESGEIDATLSGRLARLWEAFADD